MVVALGCNGPHGLGPDAAAPVDAGVGRDAEVDAAVATMSDPDAGVPQDSSTTDLLIGECEARASTLEASCEGFAGSDRASCDWRAYRELCRLGQTQLLVESMRCLEGSECRSFADTDVADCLTSVHAAGQSDAARSLLSQMCDDCGGDRCDESVIASIDIVPYLSDEDLTAVASCRGADCVPSGDFISMCASVPGVAPFASCL